MQRNDELFTPEAVDEQIERLEEAFQRMSRGRLDPPAVRMIDQLQREFGEDGEDDRSVDAVWERLLQLRRPPQPRRQSAPRQEGRPSQPSGRARSPGSIEPARPRRSIATRLSTLVAVVLLLAVVSAVVVGLVLERRPHSNGIGGIDVGTSTPTPTLPSTIYTSLSMPNNGILAALDAQNGQKRWQVNAPFAAFLAQGDGMLYVATQPDDNMILAYRTSDGSLRWQHPANGDISGMKFTQGVLYVSVYNKGLLAFGSDGTLRWSSPASGNVYQVQNGLVYLDSLYVLSASDGSVRWQAQSTIGATLLAIVGQQAYALKTQARPYYSTLYALDARTYTERWHFPQQQSFAMNVIGADQQTIYVTSYENADRLYALNASDGSVRWHQPTQESGDLKGVLAQGVIYLGGSSGTAYAFDANTGKPLWRVQMTSNIPVQTSFGDIPLVLNGVVFYSYDGDFFALNASDGTLRWHNPQIDSAQLLNLGTYLVANGTDGNAALILAFKISDGSLLWRYQVTGASIGALIAG